MKSMFYNYDRDIDKKEYPPMQERDIPKRADSFSGASLLKNSVGNILGVVAKQNSVFKLYFYLDGEVENSSIAELVTEAEFRLEIYGKDQKLMYAFPAIAYDSNTLVAEIIASDEDSFGYGVYKMKLIMTVDEEEYTLFSENNAILSID